MEDIDSFTQDYLDRLRHRRDMLAKKLADTSPRRKRSVLGESQDENIEPDNKIDDDSPNKRQCLREEEKCLKADTPAVPGIKSRLHALAARHKDIDEGNMDVEQSHMITRVSRAPRTELDASPDRDAVPAPGGRRNRFAALANNINNWEDDLSHPTVRKEEPPKKIWQPPKPHDNPKEPAPIFRENSRPSKPIRTHEYSKDASPDRKPAQNRPIRNSPVKTVTSPQKSYQTSGSNIVSSLSVTLGSSQNTNSSHLVVCPGKSTSASPQTSQSPVKPAKSPAKRDPSPVKSYQRAASPQKPISKQETPSVVNRVSALKKDTRRESFEPSAQPVSARLACWQTRVNEVETEKMDGHNNAASRINVGRTSGRVSPKKQATPEPTASSVHSRMASWEQKTQQEEQEKAAPKPVLGTSKATHGVQPAVGNSKPTPFTPGGQPHKSPVRSVAAPVTSPLKSPAKVAPAAKGIHEKLQQLHQSWQNNEIADKIRKQKEADMAVLENRWKNGVLNEDYIHQSEPAPTVSSGPPPPAPPLPTAKQSSQKPGSPVKQPKACSPVKQPAPKTPKASSPVKQPAPKTPKTPKAGKEESRAKIRQAHQELIQQVIEDQNGAAISANHDPHFESKLKTLGFEVASGHVATLDLKEQREAERRRKEQEANQSSKSKVKVTEEVIRTQNIAFNPQDKVTKTPTATATPSGGSLYGLIKKQQTPAAGPKPYSTPVSRQSGQKSKFDDSFSSDETSFEDEPAPKRIIHVEQRIEVRNPHYGSSEFSADQDTQSDTELSLDETEMDETAATTQSDEYSGDEESGGSSEGEEGVSELLDDAYSDTETEASIAPAPIPAPRAHVSPQKQVRSSQRQATSPRKTPQIERQESRQYVARKLATDPEPPRAATVAPPPKHPHLHEQQQQQQEQKRVAFRSPGGRTYRSDSSSSEQSLKRENIYSIDMYRSSANVKKNAPEPRMKIIRRSQNYDPDDDKTEDELPFIPEESAKHKIQPSQRSGRHGPATSHAPVNIERLGLILQELQELVHQEQSIISQTSNALNQCCGTNSAFAGSTEAVECHRVLLTACKKREAYLTEMSRLRSRQVPLKPCPKGSLTISDIRLPLKSDFLSRLGTVEDSTVHYFVLLFRHGAHVVFAQMVSSHDALVRGSLDIPNLIKFADVRQDFVVDLEIYSMSVCREQPAITPKKKKGMTPKKLLGSHSKKHHPAFQSPGGPSAVRTTNFTHIAGMPLTMRHVDRSHFNLDRVPFSSPLQGTIHLKLRCLMEVKVEEKGFLTMFEDVSGLGAWHRRWCVLKNYSLSYWKYPDDAKHKEPMGLIDLKSCITDEVGLVPRDVCARPNTVELITVRRQHRGEADTLVSRCYNTMTTIKHWVSADTKEERLVWEKKLNDALYNLRAWNPDALRPVKRQKQPDNKTGV